MNTFGEVAATVLALAGQVNLFHVGTVPFSISFDVVFAVDNISAILRHKELEAFALVVITVVVIVFLTIIILVIVVIIVVIPVVIIIGAVVFVIIVLVIGVINVIMIITNKFLDLLDVASIRVFFEEGVCGRPITGNVFGLCPFIRRVAISDHIRLGI